VAQWKGQYSGRTHESRVADVEASLRVAVEALRTATEKDRKNKARSARLLAERVLLARIRQIKARRSEYAERAAGGLSQAQDAVASMSHRLQELETAGVFGILREFGVEDVDLVLGSRSNNRWRGP